MIYRADHRSVKVMGRTLYKGGVRYLGNSASYIEFSFTGTRASARLVVSNDADTSEMRACMAVIVNDEEDKAKREVLADGEWEMELFVCERPETVTIRLQKLSESKYGMWGSGRYRRTGRFSRFLTGSGELSLSEIPSLVDMGWRGDGMEGLPPGRKIL